MQQQRTSETMLKSAVHQLRGSHRATGAKDLRESRGGKKGQGGALPDMHLELRTTVVNKDPTAFAQPSPFDTGPGFIFLTSPHSSTKLCGFHSAHLKYPPATPLPSKRTLSRGVSGLYELCPDLPCFLLVST